MTERYHAGERAVQHRAGVETQARRTGRTIRTSIPPPARDFLRGRQYAVLGTVAPDGRVWASLLTGKAGFITAPAEDRLRIAAGSSPDRVSEGTEVGLLIIDLATRRRLRANGTAGLQPDGSLLVRTRDVYGNCPKYIQARALTAPAAASERSSEVRQGARLTADQQRWIAGADTLFIASFHPEDGADASHRGGRPGFVRVVDDRTLQWPDYPGNEMFQTLGNIAEHPQTGLLFVDFDTGSTLQLTGQARVSWEQDRLVEFRVEQAVERRGATSLRWRLVEASPFNPPVP